MSEIECLPSSTLAGVVSATPATARRTAWPASDRCSAAQARSAAGWAAWRRPPRSTTRTQAVTENDRNKCARHISNHDVPPGLTKTATAGGPGSRMPATPRPSAVSAKRHHAYGHGAAVSCSRQMAHTYPASLAADGVPTPWLNAIATKMPIAMAAGPAPATDSPRPASHRRWCQPVVAWIDSASPLPRIRHDDGGDHRIDRNSMSNALAMQCVPRQQRAARTPGSRESTTNGVRFDTEQYWIRRGRRGHAFPALCSEAGLRFAPADTGSTFAARRAGNQLAASTTTRRTARRRQQRQRILRAMPNRIERAS